jgi:hypothetical protein
MENKPATIRIREELNTIRGSDFIRETLSSLAAAWCSEELHHFGNLPRKRAIQEFAEILGLKPLLLNQPLTDFVGLTERFSGCGWHPYTFQVVSRIISIKSAAALNPDRTISLYLRLGDKNTLAPPKQGASPINVTSLLKPTLDRAFETRCLRSHEFEGHRL